MHMHSKAHTEKILPQSTGGNPKSGFSLRAKGFQGLWNGFPPLFWLVSLTKTETDRPTTLQLRCLDQALNSPSSTWVGRGGGRGLLAHETAC